jgi:glyoxylase-like metal-dependent hydrolase (beta-lactamase superfamily II)
MKLATNLREIVPGLWAWSALQEEWKVDFCCCAWKGQDGLVLVDPVKLDDANLAKLEQVGKPVAILLTNQNHERDADWFRARYGIKVHVHRDAVAGIEITPDDFFSDGTVLPGGLKAVHVPGTCPSETAFHTSAQGGVLLQGDALVNLDKGVAFLADDYCKDPKQNRESVRKLLGLSFEAMTFAHGNPIAKGAKARVQGLFA